MKKIVSVLFVSLSLSAIGHAEHWPTGYYRSTSDPENSFYYNDENRWYCHIQNPTQAGLYGVEEQIRIVGDVYSFLSTAVSLNECPWPNGFYQATPAEEGGESPIFRLYPGNICTVTSPEMLAAYGGTDQVIVAETGSDFGSHRTELGQCFWPSWDGVSEAK